MTCVLLVLRAVIRAALAAFLFCRPIFSLYAFISVAGYIKKERTALCKFTYLLTYLSVSMRCGVYLLQIYVSMWLGPYLPLLASQSNYTWREIGHSFLSVYDVVADALRLVQINCQHRGDAPSMVQTICSQRDSRCCLLQQAAMECNSLPVIRGLVL